MKRIFNSRLRIAMLAVSMFALSIMIPRNYELVLNHSESLPLHAVIIKKGELPTKLDQAFVFFVRDNPIYQNQEVKFIKLLGGKEGDEVKINDRDFSVNEKFIGTAKTHSLKGEPLAMARSGVIPPHKFFAYTNHVDSFDSRYNEIGLIDEKDIIGTAVFAF